MENINITLIQSNLVWEDIDKNLDNLEKKIYMGITGNVHTDLIVLPEMFNSAFTMNYSKCAEDMNGKTIAWLRKIACQKHCAIVGSLIIRENGKYFNRLVWVNEDGSFQKYDKHHLFRFGKENLYYSQGNEILTVEFKGWKFRPLICYDLRFPVWSKNTLHPCHSERSEESTPNPFAYDCLIYIANWPLSRRNAWRSLIIARAIENMSYAVGVNRVGADGKGMEHSGDSVAVDYLGDVITQIKPDTEEIQTIELSYAKLVSYREKFAFHLDWDKFNIET